MSDIHELNLTPSDNLPSPQQTHQTSIACLFTDCRVYVQQELFVRTYHRPSCTPGNLGGVNTNAWQAVFSLVSPRDVVPSLRRPYEAPCRQDSPASRLSKSPQCTATYSLATLHGPINVSADEVVTHSICCQDLIQLSCSKALTGSTS